MLDLSQRVLKGTRFDMELEGEGEGYVDVAITQTTKSFDGEKGRHVINKLVKSYIFHLLANQE